MYFKTLKTLQDKYLKQGTSGKSLASVVENLDQWLVTLIPRATHFINPLQFAASVQVPWGAALQVFDDATGAGIFKPCYQYRDPVTWEILITASNKEDIIKQKTFFNENTLEEVTISSDNIETFFDLLVQPVIDEVIGNKNPDERDVLLPFTNATLKEDDRGRGVDGNAFENF
ncbi:hypothetical protein [Loigolactobacillus binensis]|uniref:Uncharacterized protein n=1 Tax=Loigolactobacillus binensis TaxID=2559922 RepID=A0ABW3ED44_9LACO|nr:hypothetical protein [Loigolactobacillus binensis]